MRKLSIDFAPQPPTARVRIIRDDPQGTYHKGDEFNVFLYAPGFVGVAGINTLFLIGKDHCEVIPMIVLKDMKFRITSDEYSEQLQKYLFNLGVRWSGMSHDEVMYTHLPFIFIGPRGLLEYTDDEQVFNDLKCVEYALQTEVITKHSLVEVEQRKKVLIDGQEYDVDLIHRALAAFKGAA